MVNSPLGKQQTLGRDMNNSILATAYRVAGSKLGLVFSTLWVLSLVTTALI